MTGLVLVIGLPNDPVLKPVLDSLKRIGANIIHWNSRCLSNDILFSCRHGVVDGWIVVDDFEPVPLNSITGVFNRISSVELTPEFRQLSFDNPLGAHAITASANLMQWCDVTPAVVMNRSLANEPNSTKAYQSLQILPFFEVPETLVTNDPDQVLQFADQYGRIIYKSCSGERSIVSELEMGDFFKRAETLKACPVLFQEWIAGIDVRVHVVGQTTIATSVSSQSTDYRYDSSAAWRPYNLSDEHAAACIALANSLDLEIAGIDLRIGSDNRAICFEVNPSPAFSAYQESTGQRISDAVARYLISGIAD